MDLLRSVLDEIRAGKTVFNPDTHSAAGMRDFQPVAKALLHAAEEGLLDRCIPHRESETGQGWYDLVVVRGGLTHKGEAFLVEQPSDPARQSAEILQLKPSLWGVGIDLKALWRRLMSRRNGPHQ